MSVFFIVCSPSTLFFVLSQRSGPWGWVLPVPLGLRSGPPRQQKRRRVCNLSLHRRKLNTHSHFSRLIKPSIFDKMGAAQVSCCVGGRFSCIGPWRVPALLGLPLMLLLSLNPYITLNRLIVQAVFLFLLTCAMPVAVVNFA